MTAYVPVLALGAALVGLIIIYRPPVAAMIFALSAPAGLIQLPGGVEVVVLMAGMLIFVAMVDRLQRGLLPLPRDFPALVAVVWSVGVVVSVLNGPNLGKPVIFGAYQIIAALTALCWAEYAGRPREAPRLLIAFLLGAIGVALTGPLMSQGGVEAAYGGAVVTGRPQGIFGQPNEYGLYCMLIFVFGLGLIMLTSSVIRLLAVVAVGIAGVGMLMSLSRGAWLGAVAGVVVLAVLIPQIRRLLAWVAGAGVLLAVVSTVSPVQIPFVSVIVARALTITEEGSNPYDLRPYYRAEGWREFQAKPIFGQGPNTFPELSSRIDSIARPLGAEHPHSFLLAVGTEQGVVGLLALGGFALAVVLAARTAHHPLVVAYRADKGRQPGQPRHLPPLGSAVVMASAAALAALMVEGFADYPLRNALSRTTVWLMVGWALAGQRLLTSRQTTPTRVSAPVPVA